jgi:hypothetical protein
MIATIIEIMIQIIVIWKLATSIGNIANQKGLKELGYQIMAVILWLCGEFFGAILGETIFGFGANGSNLLKTIFTLLGAVIGAGMAFLVMRLLPSSALVNTNDTNSIQEMSGIQKFGRSGYIPILVIVIAIFCVGVGFIGGFIKEAMSIFPQTHATNFIVGTELDSNGQVLQFDKEIPSDVDVIYLSFDFETLESVGPPPITVDWVVNNQVIHSTVGNMSSGKIIQSIDRKQLGLSEFTKGVYTVNIHIEYYPIASASFTVK